MYALRRSPRLIWACIIACAIICGFTVQHTVKAADLKEKRFGTLVNAYVATRNISPGHMFEGRDINKRTFPKAVLTDNVVTESPIHHASLISLSKGEIILRSHISPYGLQGAAALLPPEHRAIAVPVNAGTPEVHVGDNVDVIVSFDQAVVDATSSPALTIAQDAKVLAVDDQNITIAVLRGEVEKVTFALTNGTVALVLTPISDM
jgi:Flp pilus assembly protein CpaB